MHDKKNVTQEQVNASRITVAEYLCYKRVDPYLCSAKAPVLECSGVAAYTHGKVRASTVFRSCSLHVSIVGFFLLFVKKRIRGGVR